MGGPGGSELLLLGGLLYTAGVPWFLRDGWTLGVPDHTIWHLFVLAASMAHYLCSCVAKSVSSSGLVSTYSCQIHRGFRPSRIQMNTGVPHQESVLKYDDDKSDCFHADVGPSRNNCSTSNNSND